MSMLPGWLITLSTNVGKTRLIIIALLLLIIVATVGGGIALYQHNVTLTPNWQCLHAVDTTNQVKAENYCPGTNSWRVDRPLGPERAIEGFTAPVSVQAGEKVKIYISTTAATYTFQVYRMGWYNGLGGRLLYSSYPLHGINQPPPAIDPRTHKVSCSNWRYPAIVPIPTTWVSGVYIVKLLAGGYMRYAFFVVRNDSSNSSILFQTSVLTYQAYNAWGGYSLYRGSNAQGEETSAKRAYVVSFDRPFDRGDGLGDFPLLNEYNLLRWLERSGYDVSYSTDIDTDMRGALLLQHRLFVAAGHDEYWSTAMRDHVTSARDQGISLAFFGSNDIYWHVRLQSSPLGPDREVVCYKTGYYADDAFDPVAAVDPHQATVLWRDKPLNQPENALLGEMYGGALLASAPLVLAPGAAPFLSNTTLHAGSALQGLIGGEYDRVYRNDVTPSTLSILAASPVHCIQTNLCPASGIDTANATFYTASSGARVFDAGTFYWAWGLDDDSFHPGTRIPPHPYATPAFQKFTANLLTYLLG